jgi:hypothetical protein
MQKVIIVLRVVVDADGSPDDAALGVVSVLAPVGYTDVTVKSANVKGKAGRPLGWRKPTLRDLTQLADDAIVLDAAIEDMNRKANLPPAPVPALVS